MGNGDSIYLFILPPPPLSALQGWGMLLCSGQLPHITSEMAAKGWSNNLCAYLPGFCQILFWPSLGVPCTDAALCYLFNLTVHQSTMGSEICIQLSKCFFTWITVGIWAVLNPALSHWCNICSVFFLGVSTSVSLNRSSWTCKHFSVVW